MRKYICFTNIPPFQNSTDIIRRLHANPMVFKVWFCSIWFRFKNFSVRHHILAHKHDLFTIFQIIQSDLEWDSFHTLYSLLAETRTSHSDGKALFVQAMTTTKEVDHSSLRSICVRALYSLNQGNGNTSRKIHYHEWSTT